MIHTYPYSRDHYPPAPVVDVEVSRPGRPQGARLLSAFIDSGADGTLIPINVLNSINAAYVRTGRIRGLLRGSQPVDIYLVSLRIGSFTVPAVRVAAMPANSEPILGRNVLNQLIVTLNGLASVTEIADSVSGD